MCRLRPWLLPGEERSTGRPPFTRRLPSLLRRSADTRCQRPPASGSVLRRTASPGEDAKEGGLTDDPLPCPTPHRDLRRWGASFSVLVFHEEAERGRGTQPKSHTQRRNRKGQGTSIGLTSEFIPLSLLGAQTAKGGTERGT